MGRSSSPLRDHVIFIEGAPRSGTTWLVNLLAAHPEIAGVEAESHLFDFGVDQLFDNYEGRHPLFHGLWAYLERDELVDLARDSCDRILMAMRSHVSGETVPPFVVEKTPSRADLGGVDLARKRECYPDAWYVHIIRDREAVTRSLMRATFMPDRSREACGRVWDQSVQQVRDNFGDLARYREVRYEALRKNVRQECAAVCEWLGLEYTDATMEAIEILSRESYSDLGPGRQPVRDSRVTIARRELRARANGVIERFMPRGKPGPNPAECRPATSFVAALRSGDAEALRAASSPKLELVYRGPTEDKSARGEEALEELAKLSQGAFSRSYAREWWASAGATPSEWWTSAPGMPFWTAFFSGLGSDASRVDLAMGLIVENDLVHRAVVISAGSLGGRAIVAGTARVADPG
jgi:hypothetical protein